MSDKMTFVIGFHKTGTSIVSRLINSTGKFNAGKIDETICENPTMLTANDLILGHNGIKWYDLPLPNEFTVDGSMKNYLQGLKTIIGRAKINFFKDPRFCILLPVWRGFFDDNIQVVLTSRNPFDACRSLERIYDMRKDHACNLYEQYMLRLFRDLKGLPHATVQMEMLMSDPKNTFKPIANFLDIDMDEVNFNLVDEKRWRHRGEKYNGEYKKSPQPIAEKYRNGDMVWET